MVGRIVTPKDSPILLPRTVGKGDRRMLTPSCGREAPLGLLLAPSWAGVLTGPDRGRRGLEVRAT